MKVTNHKEVVWKIVAPFEYGVKPT
jgi:hypothetical protein